MNYQGVSCPVCGNAFMPEDDVVVCPECGTPHHRACYNENGGCVNAGSHGGDFSFSANIPASPEEETVLPQEAATLKPVGQISSPEELRMLIEDAQRTADEPHEGVVPPGEATPYDYGVATIVKSGYYVPRFVLMNNSGRKVLWNIMAFFFPFSWAAYRKLYKLAAILMAVNLLFLCGTVYISSKNPAMSESVEMYKAASADGELSDSEVNAISAKFAEAQQTNSDVPRALTLFMNLEIADNIVMGLFGTYFYKRKIERDAERLKDGAIEYPEYTAVLAKKGGVAILPVLIGYMVYTAAFSFLSVILFEL